MLSPLSSAEREAFLASTRRRHFARGEVVIHEGDPSDSLHLVASGRLAVRVSTPSGESVTVNLLGRGGFFGELSLLTGGQDAHRSATVVALEPTETLAVSAGAFGELCRRHPAVERLVASLLARRVEELSARLLEALYVGLDQRVQRRLSELVSVYDDGVDRATVNIPLTQDSLAELVGGTRPSVNQVLQRLAQQGIVRLGRGHIDVTDVPALRRKAAH